MAGLVPAIHTCVSARAETWMPGTRPGMTSFEIWPWGGCLSSGRGDVRAPLVGVIVMAGLVMRGVA